MRTRCSWSRGGWRGLFLTAHAAQGIDYDSWNTEGWDAASLIPLARKLETYHLDDPAVDKSLHGNHGPVHVSFGTYGVRSTQDDFLAAAAALGQKEIVDLQDFGAADGWSRWLRYISPDGKRQDAAHRYIHPLMSSGKHPNLHLLLESKVRRVVFEGTRAVGVEYEPSAASQPATALSQPAAAVVRARQLVVVSAGAISTPGILERSGVGGAERLGALGIPVVSDLACVGEEYQDHNLLLYAYKTSLQPHETLDGFLSGRLDVAAAAAAGDAMLGWNGVDIAGKLRPTDEEVSQLGPEFRELWDRDFRDKPSRPLMLFAHLSGFFGDHKALDVATDGTTTQYTTIGTYTAYPYSRGSVHVTSKDVREPPSFRTGFLTHPADLTKLVWAYKKQRDLYRRTNAFAGELAIGHPKFRAGSRAALADGPLVEGGFRSIEDRMAVPPVEYDAEDDAAIEDWIRSTLNTTWHSLGTCKMAPRDRGGVVDRHLNVYGTEGLKIAGT